MDNSLDHIWWENCDHDLCSSHSGRQTTSAGTGPEVRISSVTDSSHIVPASNQRKTNQRKPNMFSQPVKGDGLYLVSPTASPPSNQSTPRAFPLFYSKAYPLPCLFLSLCQRQVMVADFAMASADQIAFMFSLGLIFVYFPIINLMI